MVERKHSDRDALWELVNFHQRLRPKLEIQDAYKLLYQSVFGVGHIIRFGDRALECLRRELDSIDLRILPDEELVENISINKETVRINLRPFKRRNLEPEKLFEVMRASADNNRGKIADFQKIWSDFGSLVRSGAFGFAYNNYKDFDRFARNNRYPIVHHSHVYSKLYVPSYRVVEAGILFESFPELQQP